MGCAASVSGEPAATAAPADFAADFVPSGIDGLTRRRLAELAEAENVGIAANRLANRNGKFPLGVF